MENVIYIDHYDSFSANVVDWLESCGKINVIPIAYDDDEAMVFAEKSMLPLVLSPGPKTPMDVPQTRGLVRRILGRKPILGICLGHQLLGLELGFDLQHVANPTHGDKIEIQVAVDTPLFFGLSRRCLAATYNSLCLAGPVPNNGLAVSVTSWSDRSSIESIQAMFPCGALAMGVQFHPESFLAEGFERIPENYFQIIRSWKLINYPQSSISLIQ